MTAASPRTIVVAGALAAKPGNAGGVWERMSYAAGFRRLGFDVLMLEEVAAVPEAEALRWFDEAAAAFAFADTAAMVGPRGWFQGRSREDVRDAHRARLLSRSRGSCGSRLRLLGRRWRTGGGRRAASGSRQDVGDTHLAGLLGRPTGGSLGRGRFRRRRLWSGLGRLTRWTRISRRSGSPASACGQNVLN